MKKHLNFVSALILALSLLQMAFPVSALARQTESQRPAQIDTATRLKSIEEKLEKRQKELGIPGLSLAIVKDGKVILSKGFGYKDFEKKVPITADTQLAIGSATKAFTGLSVLMLQDDKKASLDDPPGKYLPYFKINNVETNAKITIRDLLSHASGLNRTDLAMLTGKLNRQELIKVAGEAKPVAGLREKFFYQNIMFAAAGEIVAEITGKPWEQFVPARVFSPLEMKNSTMSVKEMQESSDYSFGYLYNFDTKDTKRVPTRSIADVAPAGSINSSANDMAKWLQFILAGGEYGGKRLVSKEGFNEWTKTQMKVTPNGSVGYGLGWFIQEWKGKKVVQHGGNIDGFNSMVAMLPEEKLGFVLLTNVSASSLGGEMMEIVWSGMLEDPEKDSAGPEQEKEVGTYTIVQAGVDIVVAIEDGKLVAKVPQQPTYTLSKVEGRKYSLGGAPAGFFITFKDDGAFLEQPQGNVELKKKPSQVSKDGDAKADDSAIPLIGEYQSVLDPSQSIEIKEVDGAVSLVVGAQPPYPLKQNEKDIFGSPALPSVYFLKVIRGDDDQISGVTMVQPEGEFEFTKSLTKSRATTANGMSPEQIVEKVIAALGGRDNMLKITSRKTDFVLDLINQGVKGYGQAYEAAPGKSYSRTTLTALGKKIGWIEEFFDGKTGLEKYSFADTETYTGKRLEDVKFSNLFYEFLDFKNSVEKMDVHTELNGEKAENYVLSVYPKNASRVVFQIDAETFLPTKASSVVVSSTSAQQIPVSTTFSDYREVDGIKLPFKTVSINPGTGEVVMMVKQVKHNVKIKDSLFTP